MYIYVSVSIYIYVTIYVWSNRLIQARFAFSFRTISLL